MRNKKLQILGLSAAEERVYTEVVSGSRTPLAVHKETGISRTAIYNILSNLKKRNLVLKSKKDGRFYYKAQETSALSEEIYQLKSELLGLAEGQNEVAITHNSDLIVYKGMDSVKRTYRNFFVRHKKERFIGIQGGDVLRLHNELLGTGYINSVNQTIKKNKMIVEGIISNNWRNNAAIHFDTEWLGDYTGRMANIHEIDSKYFNHLGEIYIFGDTMYLISFADELIIELTHSHIAKAVRSLINYITDNTHTVNINEKTKVSFEKVI
jgi:sugar-specific transcriptional regulator TrmB